MKKFFGIIIVFTLIFPLVFSCTAASEYAPSEDAEEILSSSEYVVHAGGELWGIDADGVYRSFFGSNSAEGLMRCAEVFEGRGAVELDFNFTSDGELVCIHDWSPEYIEGVEAGVPLSYDEFIGSRIFWNFTPIDLGDVKRFLDSYPEIYIVTDIKTDNLAGAEKIAEACPEYLDRFIIQIYGESEYDGIRALGFDNVIYTLYMLPWEEKTDTEALSEFAEGHPLVGFTFPAELCDIDGFLEGMLSSGVPLYVHTVNDKSEQKKYLKLGISGIYTDFLQ